MKSRISFGTGIVIVLLLLGGAFAISLGSFNTTMNKLQNRYDRQLQERASLYDNVWKTISQKGQVAVKNDSSFQRNVDVIMTGRKSEAMFNWIQESNPNANYNEVSALYADLSRTIEGKRDEFYKQEQVTQSVVEQYNNNITSTTGSFLNLFLGKDKLVYTPITSDRTEDVMKTGKDNNVQVF